MNLSKTFANKMKLLMMTAIDMIQSLQIMFYISMLILVECIDLVNALGLKKINIVRNISMKELANGLRIYINLLENEMTSILLCVNFAKKKVILISNARTLMIELLASFVIT